MQFNAERTLISLAVASLCACAAMPALAQDAAKPADANVLDTVIVTGVRASLEQALNLKRDAVGTRDSIVAEDIGKFPEQNIADALQRIPGVEVLKDPATNEGSRVQLRGLPSQYTVTLFNGAPVRATSGGNIGSATRDFNYDIFPSELFSRVDVYKTPEAFLEEGGSAGVVDMRTPRPFDYKGRKITYSVAVNRNTSDKSNNPRGQLLFSDTWGNFGLLIQGSLTKAKQGSGGATATGHFADSRNGTSLYEAPPSPNNVTADGISLGRQFSYDMLVNSPLANLNGLTAAQIQSGFLPRIMQSSIRQADRERQGFNTSLQFKNDRWNVSLDSVAARLETETYGTLVSFPVRDASCTLVTVSPGPGQPAVIPAAPGRTCRDATARNANTGSVNNGLIPIKPTLDANNMLGGTFGNFAFLSQGSWVLSKTKFDYNALNVEFKATDALTLNAQLAQNKSVAWRSQSNINADNNFADGVVPSKTGTSGFTLDPAAVNRHTVTIDLSDPLFPSIATNRNLLDPNVYATFSNSGGGYVTETDKQKIGKLNAAYEYEAKSLRGTLRGGVSLVESTKNVDLRNVPNLLNNLTLPNGKLFTAATLFERAEFMRTFLAPNSTSNVTPQAGNSYPREYLTVGQDTIKNTFNALELNRNAEKNGPGSFNTVEKVSAVYLQNDLEFDVFGRPLRTNVGVRYVKTDVDVDNFVVTGTTPAVGNTPGTAIFGPGSFSTSYNHTLPSLSVAYDLMKDVVLRGSAGKTITRSSVSAISRSFNRRGSGGDLQVDKGNPELVPEESSSQDVSAEWYFAKGGILALTGYNKSFTGRVNTVQSVVPFSSTGLPCNLFTLNNFLPTSCPGGTSTDINKKQDPDTQLFTPLNRDNFKIKGLELTYQQSFSFLPSPFNGLGVYGSYARNNTSGADRKIYTSATQVTVESVPLVPKNTYSIAAYYEQGPVFLRLSYNHKSEWATTETGANGYGFQYFSNARGFLDASFGYKFNKALEVRFDATNLTNQETYDYFKNYDGRFGDPESRINNGTQVGRGYAISLRGSF